MRRTVVSVLLVLSGMFAAPLSAAVPSIDDFVRRESFGTIKISPDGTYYAATVPTEGRDALIIMTREGLQKSASTMMPPNNYIENFWWVGNDRVVFSASRRAGLLEKPQLTGELFTLQAASADGGKILAGQRAHSQGTGSNIRKDDQQVFAELIATLPNDPEHVLVSVWSKEAGFPSAERMNVRHGRRTKVARAPIAATTYLADPHGEVRFAFGVESDGKQRTFHRAAGSEDWVEINNQRESHEIVTPVGFSADARTAYLEVRRPGSPDFVVAWDPATGTRTRVAGDDAVDPVFYLHSPVDGGLYGVVFHDAPPRIEYLDPQHPFARLHAQMAASFKDQLVVPTSFARDGTLGLFFTMSDRNPGDYYLLDLERKSADLVLSHAEWLYPDELAPTTPIALNARDGLPLHGFLTTPRGSDGRNLPLIVNPHGGPFNEYDSWLYDMERQLLASRGYAVLQVNFRGSDNYGNDFEVAGYRQWGRAMQDDLTDATRWAIDQGIADPARICIYGSSYGGYAALMGAAREPDLYRCAAGNVGVYELDLMYSRGDIESSRWGRNYLKDTLGTEGLAEISPTTLAGRIRAPVFLAAGREDERAPAVHTERMEKALKAAGVPVEAKIYPNEGHGYFQQEVRLDYYRRLVAFFDTHLGAAPPKTAP